jgi:hypothetical protein
MELGRPATPSAGTFRGSLPLEIASPIVLLLAVVAIGLVAPDRWNWVYLFWGLGIGLLGAANQQLIYNLVLKLMDGAPAQSDQTRQRGRLRKNMNVMGSIAVGLAAGALSAIFNNIAFVLIGTILLVIASVIPYLLLPMMLRRVRNRGSG